MSSRARRISAPGPPERFTWGAAPAAAAPPHAAHLQAGVEHRLEVGVARGVVIDVIGVQSGERIEWSHRIGRDLL